MLLTSATFRGFTAKQPAGAGRGGRGGREGGKGGREETEREEKLVLQGAGRQPRGKHCPVRALKSDLAGNILELSLVKSSRDQQTY